MQGEKRNQPKTRQPCRCSGLQTSSHIFEIVSRTAVCSCMWLHIVAPGLQGLTRENGKAQEQLVSDAAQV